MLKYQKQSAVSFLQTEMAGYSGGSPSQTNIFTLIKMFSIFNKSLMSTLNILNNSIE